MYDGHDEDYQEDEGQKQVFMTNEMLSEERWWSGFKGFVVGFCLVVGILLIWW